MYFEDFSSDKVKELAKKMESFFVQNPNVEKTAYMNWRINFDHSWASQFKTIADGYYDSAIKLIDICLDNNFDKKADSLIFPILFNIVHGTELYLKAINASLNTTIGEMETIEGGHQILQLCQTAHKKLQDIKKITNICDIDDMLTAMKLVENFIKLIYEKTADMSFARYPIDSKKKDMFYVATRENIVIDLEKLRIQFLYVYSMIEFIYDTLDTYQEFIEEIKDNCDY